MASAPTLTVGVPVFNGARYLEAAVQSVLDQSFGDLELIISDNASTDETARIDPVQPRGRSAGARAKERDHRTPDGLPVGSFRTLLRHLATLTENRIVPAGLDERAAFSQLSVPTALQDRAFDLLGFTPGSV